MPYDDTEEDPKPDEEVPEGQPEESAPLPVDLPSSEPLPPAPEPSRAPVDPSGLFGGVFGYGPTPGSTTYGEGLPDNQRFGDAKNDWKVGNDPMPAVREMLDGNSGGMLGAALRGAFQGIQMAAARPDVLDNAGTAGKPSMSESLKGLFGSDGKLSADKWANNAEQSYLTRVYPQTDKDGNVDRVYQYGSGDNTRFVTEPYAKKPEVAPISRPFTARTGSGGGSGTVTGDSSNGSYYRLETNKDGSGRVIGLGGEVAGTWKPGDKTGMDKASTWATNENSRISKGNEAAGKDYAARSSGGRGPEGFDSGYVPAAPQTPYRGDGTRNPARGDQVASNDGTTWRYDGSTWQQVSGPSTASSTGATPQTPYRGDGTRQPVSGDRVSSQDGAVWQYDGNSWVQANPPATRTAPPPTNSSPAYAAGSSVGQAVAIGGGFFVNAGGQLLDAGGNVIRAATNAERAAANTVSGAVAADAGNRFKNASSFGSGVATGAQQGSRR